MSESEYKHKHKEFKHKGLQHGGRISAAAKKYQIAKEDWIDLSTGLNPNSWPVPVIPAEIWQSLPEDNDDLQTAACQYYACEACLPVAGSQAAIQMLPALRSCSKVGVISPTYAEHEYNWQQAGHDVIQLRVDEVETHINQLDVLVVINPNNPSGEVIEVERLLGWHQQLVNRAGWLIVDEAFMDITPEKSLLASGIKPGLIVLRSLGKFFGLAGVRCGFVMSDAELLQRLAQKSGPWSLTGATRYIAIKALRDKNWQLKTRKELVAASARLNKLLRQAGLDVDGETALFQWLRHPKAKEIYTACAEKGILIRFFNAQEKGGLAGLRFGLPENNEAWLRLSETLQGVSGLIESTEKKASYV